MAWIFGLALLAAVVDDAPPEPATTTRPGRRDDLPGMYQRLPARYKPNTGS